MSSSVDIPGLMIFGFRIGIHVISPLLRGNWIKKNLELNSITSRETTKTLLWSA